MLRRGYPYDRAPSRLHSSRRFVLGEHHRQAPPPERVDRSGETPYEIPAPFTAPKSTEARAVAISALGLVLSVIGFPPCGGAGGAHNHGCSGGWAAILGASTTRCSCSLPHTVLVISHRHDGLAYAVAPVPTRAPLLQRRLLFWFPATHRNLRQLHASTQPHRSSAEPISKRASRSIYPYGRAASRAPTTVLGRRRSNV